MKRCPKCNREYTDDTLRFCLDDGASLASLGREEPPPTEILPAAQPITKASPERTIPSFGHEPFYSPEPPARRTHPIVIAGVIAIVLLLIVLVALAAVYVIQHSAPNKSSQTAVASPSPRVSTLEPTRQANVETTPTPRTGGPLQITATASSVRFAVQATLTMRRTQSTEKAAPRGLKA